MIKIFEMTQAGGNDVDVVVVSDCTDEREFFRQLSNATLLAMAKKKSNGQLFLELLLHRVADITCRLRGYKNEVKERRLMMAGEFWPPETSAAIGHYGDINGGSQENLE